MIGCTVLSAMLFLGFRPASAADPRGAGTCEMARELASLGHDFDRRLVEQPVDLGIDRYLRHVRKGVDERSRISWRCRRATACS